jgi:hypothetical protein
MPAQLISSAGCCVPCDTTPLPVQIPGPQGPAGADGSNGINGGNAWTTTVSSFTVPAYGANVSFDVYDPAFIPVLGDIYLSIGNAGYFKIQSVAGYTVTVQNPALGTMGSTNAVPGTIISSGTLVSVAGAVGAPGTNGTSGAPVGAKYVVLEPDPSLTAEVALSAYSAGYMKTGGSTGTPLGVISTTSTIPVSDITGTVPISKGGTNITTTPTNGKLLIGNGTGYTLANLTAGTGVTITNGAGSITIASSAGSSSLDAFTVRLPSQVSCPSSSSTNPFTTFGANVDSLSGWNSVTGAYSVKSTSGVYRVVFLTSLQSGSANQLSAMTIKQNGTVVCSIGGINTTTAQYHPMMIEYVGTAVFGDTFSCEMTVSNTTGSSVLCNQYTSMSVSKIA